MMKCVVAAIASVSILAGSMVNYRFTERRNEQSSTQLRETMIALQLAEQGLARLEAGRAHPLLEVLGEDISDLQIRLSEALSAWKSSGVYVITAFEQSLLPATELHTDINDVARSRIERLNILRLDVQATVGHAPEFLRWLEALNLASGGWPSEIRGCDIRRMPVRVLAARCVMDFYHWTMGGSQ